MTGTRNTLVRFLSVGLAVTAIDLGLTYLLILLSGVKLIAVTGGFVSGLLAGYLLHARISFSASLDPGLQVPRLLTLALINYLLTLGCVYLATDLFGLGVMTGKYISLVVVAANSYLVSRHWVYSCRAPRRERSA
jgi:putative flippase GtrA